MNGLRVSEEGEVTCRGRAQHCCSDLVLSSFFGLGYIRNEKSAWRLGYRILRGADFPIANGV